MDNKFIVVLFHHFIEELQLYSLFILSMIRKALIILNHGIKILIKKVLIYLNLSSNITGSAYALKFLIGTKSDL